ncbi:hypothetical protein LJC69_05080 [Bacteroidales bacterium OttesenSCG-928-K22]|nr:hypothetical protein [Bacteroidales bacterium OttesenSCG-928-K22]
MIVSEVILKEKEKFDFSIIGINDDIINEAILSINNEYGNIVSKNNDSIELVRDLFYKYISFDKHFDEAKTNGNSHYELKKYFLGNTNKYLLNQYYTSPKALLDKEFNINRTVSYLLSQDFFSNWFSEFLRKKTINNSIMVLNDFFYSIADNTFPLNFETFYSQLKSDDREFWDRTAELLLLISKNVTKSFNPSFNYEADQIVPDTYEILKKSVEEGKDFNDVKHFKGHIWLICKNKFLEFMREETKRIKSSNIDVEKISEIDYSEEFFSPFDDSMSDFNYNYRNINLANKYEVSMLIAIVLSDKFHPLYPKLIEGDEEKIDLLIDIAVNELSYDDIIDKKYSNGNLNDSERRKLNAKLRQDYVRIRKKLIDKTHKLLEAI